MNKHRAFNTPAGRTTVLLEPETWRAVDALAAMDSDAKGNWQAWVNKVVKPGGESRAKQIRVAVIASLTPAPLAA